MSSSTAPFVIGIDLGTTNSALCYSEVEPEPEREADGGGTPAVVKAGEVRVFGVPQLVAPSEVESREVLPSFRYQASDEEFGSDATALPWGSGSGVDPGAGFVGQFARDHGIAVPGRLVASAKSWLCHTGVDRTQNLLPWQSPPDVERISPIEASASYLAHFRSAWDAAHPDAPLAEQDVVVTLPASFDEIARELTVQAARRAGLPRITLLEEPQAAFYAWIDRNQDRWEEAVQPGQTILVCDVGGGTSDFSLIRVRPGTKGQPSERQVQFHRIAVGEHLILGGDNLDLALAKHLEEKLGGSESLTPRQWEVLVRSCRQVKEVLLGGDPPAEYTVNLPGRGSGLIGGSLQVSITREEVESVLVDGFLPLCDIEAPLESQTSGFREFGLPYASDPAMTRHLATFLRAHRDVLARENETYDIDRSGDADPARPDIVLFNGGLFASSRLRERMCEAIANWFRTPSEPDWNPIVLDNDRLDLAVARGAAYFGLVRRGIGVRIAAGLARTYYIGVASGEDHDAEGEHQTGSAAAPMRALCLLPAGIEPGEEVRLSDRTFELLVSEPVEFPLFSSSLRQADRPGDLLEIDSESMTALPPIRTVLKSRSKADTQTLPVHLHARLTEIGTLDLWCQEVSGPKRWKLQFDVRSTTQTDRQAHTGEAEQQGILDESDWRTGLELIDATFGETARNGEGKPPGKLAKSLGRVWSMSRKDWPPSLLRCIWEALIDREAGRRLGAAHEARWLNLLGFGLRPGYGLAMDDWRVAETWRLLGGRLIHGTPACRAEWWILWRRVAGGLAPGQQQSLAEPLLASLRTTHRQMTTGRGKGGDLDAASHEAAEIWRLLGSFELLPLDRKIELGGMACDLIGRSKLASNLSPMLWAIGRLGAREPLYGPLNSVIPVDVVTRWVDRILQAKPDDDILPVVLMQLCRKTDDRYRDVGHSLRDRVLNRMRDQNAAEHLRSLVREGGHLEAEEERLVFGEALPRGLRI